VASFNFKLLWAIIVSFSLAIPSVLNFGLSAADAAAATPCFQLNEHTHRPPSTTHHPPPTGAVPNSWFHYYRVAKYKQAKNKAKTKKA